MNIITKIKNWLIKKLGGYTEEEYNTAEEPWYTIAADYRDKYNTEHENYLALLNAYNTLAEQKQKPIEMAKALKAYCAEHDTCEGCDLADESGICATPLFSNPCFWEVG